MAGKSPRLRNRALAEVFFKNEMLALEEEKEKMLQDVTMADEQNSFLREENKKLRKDNEELQLKLEEVQLNLKNTKKEHERMLASYIEKLKKVEEEPESGKKKKKGN